MVTVRVVAFESSGPLLPNSAVYETEAPGRAVVGPLVMLAYTSAWAQNVIFSKPMVWVRLLVAVVKGAMFS